MTACRYCGKDFLRTQASWTARLPRRPPLLVNLAAPGILLAVNQRVSPRPLFMLFAFVTLGCYLRQCLAAALWCTAAATVATWPFAGVMYGPLGLIVLSRYWTFLKIWTFVEATPHFELVVQWTRSVTENYSFFHRQSCSVQYRAQWRWKVWCCGVEPMGFYVRGVMLYLHVFFPLGVLAFLMVTVAVVGRRRAKLPSRSTQFAS